MDSIAAILAQVQAYSGGGQATQPQPQAPTPAPPSMPDSSQPNLLAILSTLNAANQQQQAPQSQPVVAPAPQAAPTVPDLSQLWMQLAQQQQQQQQQQQPQQQTLADLIGTLTGQQKPATSNPLGYAGFNPAAQAAVWGQYATTWGAPTSHNSTPVNAPDTNTGEEPRLSGKDIRERLREQVGWIEPLFDEESNNPSSSGRDGHGRDGSAGGKNWKKEKQWKKNKKNKNKFGGGGGGGSGGSGGSGGGGDHQHQGENGGNTNGGGGTRNNMCKYYSKGQCQMGNSCKFSHPDDTAGDGGVKQGGGGGGGRGGWKEKKRGGHGGHGGGGHHGPRGGNLDAEAGRSEWVEGLEY